MAAESDEQQMLRVRAGDREAFTGLVEKYHTPLVRFLFRIVHNAALAEDLAQEVFLRLYRARHRYRPMARFSTWLYTVATNLALNSLRDGRVRRAHELPAEVEPAGEAPGHEGLAGDGDPEPSLEQRLIESERLAQIRRAVDALPEKQRLAVLLHKYEEMDYAEIARVLGLSESALKSLLFRAYETLRLKLRSLVATRLGEE